MTLTTPITLINAMGFICRARNGRKSFYDKFSKLESAEYYLKSPIEMMKKFGAQYSDYILHTLDIEKIRNACRIASQTISDVPERRKRWAADLAALSMGCIAPLELTTKICLDAFFLGQSVVRMSLSAPFGKAGHILLISGDVEAIWSAHVPDENIERFLSKLGDCILLDPYLDTFCHVRDFDLSDIKKHLDFTKIDIVGGMECIDLSYRNREGLEDIWALAEKIENKAYLILHSPENTNAKIKQLNKVASAILACFPIFENYRGYKSP